MHTSELNAELTHYDKWCSTCSFNLMQYQTQNTDCQNKHRYKHTEPRMNV